MRIRLRKRSAQTTETSSTSAKKWPAKEQPPPHLARWTHSVYRGRGTRTNGDRYQQRAYDRQLNRPRFYPEDPDYPGAISRLLDLMVSHRIHILHCGPIRKRERKFLHAWEVLCYDPDVGDKDMERYLKFCRRAAGRKLHLYSFVPSYINRQAAVVGLIVGPPRGKGEWRNGEGEVADGEEVS